MNERLKSSEADKGLVFDTSYKEEIQLLIFTLSALPLKINFRNMKVEVILQSSGW